MSFFLYPGNRLETLAGIYCRRIFCDPGSDPLEQETVVVQTQGMAAYLRQFIARRCGIAANMAMPFPEGFISRVLKANLPEYEKVSENFSQETLAWQIFAIFQQSPEEFPELAGYLKNGSDELHLWQLARCTAALFDRYQIYRYTDDYFPLTGEQWQTRLWKKLLNLSGKSKMRCFRDFLRKDTPIAGLPKRLTVFGVGSLPPLYLDIFFKIASVIDLHFFYLTPCREFWEGVYSVREQRWIDPAGNLPEVGNPLLASWGESGRELFTNLLNHQDTTPYVSSDDLLFDDYISPGSSGSVLAHIQQDILTMHDARRDNRALPPDDSLEILNCHSPRREIEILHDKLVSLISSKEVEPRDVIVMAPDINNYLPYIESVFAQGPLKDCFTVSDRNLHSGCGIGDAFCALLKLSGSRMDTDEVISILSHQAVFTAFGLKVNDLESVNRYLESSGIRWGLDAEDHRRYCGVAFEEYSWYHGIDRIFENFTMDADDLEKIPGDPLILAEGELELFGKFNRFIRKLAELRNNLSVKRDLRQWMEFFQQILETFFQEYDKASSEEIAALRQFFTEKWLIGKNVDRIGRFSLEVMLDVIGTFLNSSPSRFSFLRGKITFCSLTPLRSIPAQVIAVLGMDDGAFPRRDVTVSFDLMSSKLLPGDRSGAKEDRYLFLEALMSARRSFWCFYNGRSRFNGKILQPSTVLGELMDYLKESCKITEIQHYLQDFDPRYFQVNGKLRSNSRSSLSTAKLLASSRNSEPPGRKYIAPLIPYIPNAGFKLEEFIKWAKHPLSYIFANSLDCKFQTPDAARAREPITSVSGLQCYTVDRSIAEYEKLNIDPAAAFDILKRMNILPPGEAGIRTFTCELDKIKKIPAPWRQSFYAQNPVAAAFDLEIPLFSESRQISGILNCSDTLDEQKIMVCASLKHSHYADAVMRHHALCMISDAPVINTSLYTFDNGKWHLTRWSGAGKNEYSALFWKRFIAVWERGFRQMPALFPETLFDMTKKHRKAPEIAMADMFDSEYKSDRFISGCFTSDALNAPEIVAELQEFFDLFYADTFPGDKK